MASVMCVCGVWAVTCFCVCVCVCVSVYALVGRMILLFARCSIIWAAQPAVRATTKIGVKKWEGIPEKKNRKQFIK